MIESLTLTHQDFSLPRTHFCIPVCIGDLPSSEYHVTADTITFDVVRYLRDHEEIPGVMVSSAGQPVNVLPRLRLFERLGQLYGTDLFIRKPIEVLCQNLMAEAFCLPEDLRVDDAVQAALGRPLHNAYDPVVVLAKDRPARLVDAHTLLTVQSRILTNMNNSISNLHQVKRLVARNRNLSEVTDLVLDSLNEVVAFHQAAVLLHKEGALHLVAGRGLPADAGAVAPDRHFMQSSLFGSMTRIHRSIQVEDMETIPERSCIIGHGIIHSWMGTPLFGGTEMVGLITLARTSLTPFRKNEADMLDAYARLISIYLQRERSDLRGRLHDDAFRAEGIRQKHVKGFMF